MGYFKLLITFRQTIKSEADETTKKVTSLSRLKEHQTGVTEIFDSAEDNNSGICTKFFRAVLYPGHLIVLTVTLEFIIDKSAPSGKCRITNIFDF